MGEGIVLKKSPEELYKERWERITTALSLEVPDRVPIVPSISVTPGFVARYGGVTVQQIMYDYEKCVSIHERLIEDFPEWDAIFPPFGIWPAPVFDASGQILYKIPGKDLPPDLSFQYVEACHMDAEEYDLLIEDPNEYLLTKYLPRIFREETSKGSIRANVAFMKGALAYGSCLCFWREKFARWKERLGMPLIVSGMTKAPFDVLTDTLRGMRESLLDIRVRPDKVLKACERLVPYCVKYAEITGEAVGEEYPIFIPLHRGIPPFMSRKESDTFYWSTLREVICQLADLGFICRPFAEGDWTPNLDYWREVPKGKVLLHLDRADIFKAKEIIGDNVCLTGNVPPSLLELGTPRQVEEYCKRLIDVVGEGGGYIMDAAVGIPDRAKIENVKAMTEFTAKYGVYRR